MGGGGGRGMRAVQAVNELPAAYDTCRREAQAAFGVAGAYVERLMLNARHIEVQVLGGGAQAIALGERECTLQRRFQKLVEIAPSPSLPDALRLLLIQDALAMAREVRYEDLGTFEFLVDLASSDPPYVFTECNSRLQVEHTITEDVTGVRVDTHAVAGGAPSPHYDTLRAKLIVSTRGGSFADVLRRSQRALAECRIDGLATNLALLQALAQRPEMEHRQVHARWVEEVLSTLPNSSKSIAAKLYQTSGSGQNNSKNEPLADDAAPHAVRAPLPVRLVRYAVAEGAECPERDALFQKLVAKQYANGEAMHMAATLEIDAVIDPADTRAWLVRGLASARVGALGPRFIDTW